MIQERYCSCEVSKLLREKGFDEEVRTYYQFDNETKETELIHDDRLDTPNLWGSDYVSAPTHQMAIDWLRQKHGILISIIPQEIAVGVYALCYGIYRIIGHSYNPIYNGQAATLNDYKNVVEAALEFCLTELI